MCLYAYFNGENYCHIDNYDFLNLGSNVEVLMSGNVRCYNIVVEVMKVFSSVKKFKK